MLHELHLHVSSPQVKESAKDLEAKQETSLATESNGRRKMDEANINKAVEEC